MPLSPAETLATKAVPAPASELPSLPPPALAAEGPTIPPSLPPGVIAEAQRSRSTFDAAHELQFVFFDNSLETPASLRRWLSGWRLLAIAALLLICLSGLGLYRFLAIPNGYFAKLFNAIHSPMVELGVDLRDVTYTRQTAYGLGTVLTIHGKLANSSTTPLPTPRAIQIVLADAKNAKLYQTAVKPTVPKLGPGESVAFTATIYDAPEGAMHLNVTLVR